MFRSVFLIFFLISHFSLDDAFAAEKDLVTIATGLPKPPFIIDETKGMQLDLLKEALKLSGITVAFKSLPLNRNLSAFQRFDVDGIALLPKGIEMTGIYPSHPYISYQNVAVSLLHNDLKISNISDLTGKSIVGFQNAHKFLGRKFRAITKYSLEYREVADQAEQFKLLESGAAEVIVLDINILKYYLKSHRALADNLQIHQIFPKNLYRAGFNSDNLALLFNKGLKSLKLSGRYDEIIESYIGKH